MSSTRKCHWCCIKRHIDTMVRVQDNRGFKRWSCGHCPKYMFHPKLGPGSILGGQWRILKRVNVETWGERIGERIETKVVKPKKVRKAV